MTTTDARKRNRDMRDAHETARERDEPAKAGHPIEWFVYDETQTFTREHLTEWQHAYLAPANPRPGDVVQYLGHATTQSRDAAWMLGALNGTGPRDRTHTDQETDMDYRTPDQKRHEELVGLLKDIAGNSAEEHALLAEIRDRLPEYVKPTLEWLDEPIPVPRPEREDESVCGNMESNTCDFPCAKPPHGDDEWHDSGRGYRWRVDEPADITEEPPAGSQVTDREGDVWEQVGAGWQVWDRTASMWGGRTGWGSSVGPRSHAPLRPTTDADRVRVGLKVEPAPADVDPDEALAIAMFVAQTLSRPGWDGMAQRGRDNFLAMARAAREHLMARETYTEEGGRILIAELRKARASEDHAWAECGLNRTDRNRQKVRADKAEADLARVADARDRHSRAADKWCNLYADKCEEIESVQAKADRYDALREDGALAKAILHSLDFPPSSLLGEAVTAAVTDVLAAHDRAAKGVQS